MELQNGGNGVERLLQINKESKILGLSATPLRYLDGLRDMAEELFENNIASEMSLEEAIERGILPKATYVSALYGYTKELEKMQENIDKIKDKEKHQEAQNLLNYLRGKLDESTYNLSELLSTYMQNPNGKYIIFCRNIEDMNEKIKQAQEMFGMVNPNITVRGVSSKIKESDRILTEFEQDTDESTLKLLYTVNMVNEGYHIEDLDGVVMMRPTFSPTIFTQQLGRALTVGGDKEPVVLDLVNNFDSCKIIEDFTERMRQYNGRDGSGKRRKANRIIISIFDKTKEFREIAAKIIELSSRKMIPLDEKIKIFEEFSKTGEELVGNTIFEGYPIGQWAIQIRSLLNKFNNGKGWSPKTNFTNEQLERLANSGVLERGIDSNIDEKIDMLVEWRRKYPKITIIPNVSDEILSEYTSTEEELTQLIKEYKKMQGYYEYVRIRKSKGKLNEEQIEKCKEGNVNGVFGDNTEIANAIENETNTLIEKYGLNEKTIDFIRKHYGSIDGFRKIYIEALINHNVNQVISKNLLESVNLIRGFDFNSCDWIARNNGLVDFINDVSDKGNVFIKYDGLEEEIIKLINGDKFTEQQKQVLFMLYGINGEKKVNQAQISKNIDKSPNRIHQIVVKSMKKIKSRHTIEQLDLENRMFDIDYDLQKEIIEEYFKNFDIFVPKEQTSMDENVENKLTNMLLEAVEKTKKRKEQIEIIESMPIEQRLEIIKARFGEKINSSDFSVIPPWHFIYKFFEGNNSIDINEKLLSDTFIYENRSKFGEDINFFNLSKQFIYNIYKECVDSEYSQAKIAEFMIKSDDSSRLTEVGKKEQLEEIIASNGYFSEEKKIELKEMLEEKIAVAEEGKIIKEIEAFKSSTILKTIEQTTIKKLRLSTRSSTCLIRSGINTIEDLLQKTKQDIMSLKNLGKKSYDEIIGKMQSFGIEMVDGHFVYEKDSEPDIEKMRELEEKMSELEGKINSNEYISEEKKEELRKLLHETFNVTRNNNQGTQSDLEDIESSKSSEEVSKEELVESILEKQEIIKEQLEEIADLSSQKKGQIDE